MEAGRSLLQAVDRLSVAFGYLAGGMYVVLAFFITYDVLARKWGAYFGLPTTQVTDEISGYMLALAATWGFGYALRCGAHVRRMLPSSTRSPDSRRRAGWVIG